jgi:hypothetical protein
LLNRLLTLVEKPSKELYSDWLAWIIQQLPSARVVFQVLGIKSPAEYGDCCVSACREKSILDNSRKLDVVVSLDGKPLVVVEIKKKAAEDESGKLRDYRKWADGNSVPYMILLGIEGESSDDDCGFEIRQWADVCVELRKCSGEICEKKGVLAAAMVLAFVGAVEQNLLGFSAPMADSFSRNWPEITKHVRRSLIDQGEQP